MKKKYESKKILVSFSLVLGVIITVVGILLVIFYFKSLSERENMKKNLNLSSEKYAELIDLQIKENLATINAITTFLNTDYSLEEIANNLIIENERNRFSKMLYVRMNYKGILVDMEKNEYRTITLSKDPFFELEEVLKGQSKVKIISLNKKESLCYIVPVYEGKEVIGVMLAVDTLSSFQNILKIPSYINDCVVELKNQEGDVILSAYSEKEIATKQGEKEQEVVATHKIENGDWYVSVSTDSIIQDDIFQSMTIVIIGMALFISILYGGLFLYMINIIYKGKERVNYLAFYNPITGILNKNGFLQEFSKLTSKSEEYTFVVLNIRDFKFINHYFGYAVGNQLLCHIAKVLKAELKEEEVFYHKESDRFGFLLHTQEKQEIIERVQRMMEKISEYQLLPEQRYPISCYCGIKILHMFSKDLDVEEMIDRAQFARLSVHEHHGNQYAFYDEDMYKKAQKKNEIEKQMNKALESEEFKIYIQPKYDLKTEKICGGEALVRWQLKDGKIVPPMDFIPIFEQNGFISKLDLYMFEKVCQFQHERKKEGFQVYPLSVNQSKILILEKDYIQKIRALMEKYEILEGEIIVEITESISTTDMLEVENIIESLHKIGIGISMDDFGSGYSSLNVLRELPIDELKIDRVFLMSTKYEEKKHVIMESIIHMAKKCQMQVVCEGVETGDHVKALQTMCCDIAQGYYYAKPMTEDEFLALLYREREKGEN